MAEISVADDTRLADVTSVGYNKTSGDVTVETKDRVDWSLKGPSGTAVTEGVTYNMTTLTIPTANLPQGAYTLTLQRDSEKLVLTLKMGNK